jgi:4-hydroxy-3-methylbut-2-en-1-yl diphosphate synthase IspG/GcpE
MAHFLKTIGITTLLLCGVLTHATSLAQTCMKEISAVDQAVKKQYGADRTWKNILGCPICLDGELRKDAIVTKAQIKEISYFRNIAYMQMNRGDEKMCHESLKTPKRLLRVW